MHFLSRSLLLTPGSQLDPSGVFHALGLAPLLPRPGTRRRAQGAPAPGSAHPASDKPEAAEDAGAGYSAEQKKQTVRVLLLQLEGALGARSSLADFQRADEDDCPWMLIGEAGTLETRRVIAGIFAGVIFKDGVCLPAPRTFIGDSMGCNPSQSGRCSFC